ncbi:NYN domain-containing protein [Candidatus Latescibacterota bacterium]
MNRTVFLIDGFNLYHSLIDVRTFLRGASTKWLNINSLCSSYLPIIGNNAQLSDIYYFSALATHLQHRFPQKIARHRKFIRCIESFGINVELGRFKQKNINCPHCHNNITKYEEKETDVAIASKLLELSFLDKYDTAVLVTGDTDLAPAARSIKNIFCDKKVIFAFPYRRRSDELATLAPGSFSIGCNSCARHQLPNPVVLENGTRLFKPDSW